MRLLADGGHLNHEPAFFGDVNFAHIFADVRDDRVGWRDQVFFEEISDPVIDAIGISGFFIGQRGDFHIASDIVSADNILHRP